MTAVDDLRAATRERIDRRNMFAAAAVGSRGALDVVEAALTSDNLHRGAPVVSDVAILVESLAAGDRPALRALTASWTTPDNAGDSPWFANGWITALRHLEPDVAAKAAAGSEMLSDEMVRIVGDDVVGRTIVGACPDTSNSLIALGAGGRLAIDWTTRRLAHCPLDEEAITARQLDQISAGWLRILRGRFELLADDTITVLRRWLDAAEPDPYEIALIVEAGRAKSFDLDELVADRLMTWTKGGSRSWNGFEATLTLLTDWVVP